MRDGSETKIKIDRAALELFVRKGIPETTIRDVTKAAGITEGALYRHYSGKEKMTEDLFRRHYLELTRKMEETLRGKKSLRERLPGLVELFCRLFDEDPVLYSFLLLSQHNELRDLRKEKESPVAVIKSIIAEAVKKKEIPPIPPGVGTALVMGLVLETAKFVVYERIPGKMMDFCPLLARSCLKVLSQ